MSWEIPSTERTYLRELARKQAEIAALPVMAERKKNWYALNDGKPGSARLPVIVETWTFDRDFLPESVFVCKSKTGLQVERQLLRNIRNHELINDDKVMPDAFEIGWFIDIDEFGVKIETETLKDFQGVETGYRYLHPIKNLREDFSILKPTTCRVDKEKTLAYKAWLEELFGDLLSVEIGVRFFGQTMLTNRVIELMGMEAFFLAIYDSPDMVHSLMAYLRDNCLSRMKWTQDNGLLRVNNGNQDSFGSSYNFTNRLPAPGYVGPEARLCDMWSCANSQESVGISPEMYHEFCFPYYRDAVAPLGLMYYGCCEAVHPFWDDIRQYPHLKKVSISRWCNEAFMGEALQGTEIIYSRKPDPRFLGIDVKLDEEGWTAHIRETLEKTKGVAVEIIVRDVYTVHGNLGKPHRAVELARKEIDKHYRG